MTNLAQPRPALSKDSSATPSGPSHSAELTAEHRDRLLRDFNQEAVATSKQDMRLLFRVWPYLKPYAGLMLLALVTIPLSTYAALRQPLATKQAVDGVTRGETAVWVQALVIYAVAVVVQVVTTFVENYSLQLAGQRAMADLRAQVFAHAQRVHTRYYDRTPVGRVLTRITNDVDAMGELFSSGAAMALADLLMLVGIVYFMLSLDVQLSLVAFAALPPTAIVVEWIRRRARAAFRDIRARVSQLNAYLSEQVQGVQVVQAFGREAMSAAEYRAINDAYRDANHRSIRYDAWLFSSVDMISHVCVAAVLWWASVRAGLLQAEGVSLVYLGTVAAFYQYLIQFFVPIRDLSTKYTVVQSALAAAERVFGFLDLDELEPQPQVQTVGKQVDMTHSPLIQCDDVRFGYRADEEVLHGVSLNVQRGEHIAIVGATGAGKSSTIALLLGFYRAQGGEVRLGGVNLADLTTSELRRHIALVPQDVFLFSGTVGENVAMGKAENPAEVEDALRQVSAWDLLADRGGIDARVEERGANFSAGERQLIAFARALYRDASILVLDEATANIDSETEARVQAAIDTLIRDRTAIVVAHRLSTIRKADRILVFHRGLIAEEGTHDALLARGGIYAHLHKLQFEEQ